jgi:hypothetical protein
MSAVAQQAAIMGLQERRDVTDGNTGFFRDSESVPRHPSGETEGFGKASRNRTLIIAISAAAVVVVGIVAIVLLAGGSKNHADAKGTAAKPKAVVTSPPTGSDTEVRAPAVDAGTADVKKCIVAVDSQPRGAEIAIGKTTVLGTTPGKFELPCGVETKLYVRKDRFIGTIKTVTATAETPPVVIKLAPAVFSVKVTSTPSGATITVGGKSMGVTPTTIKLPAFATSTITITKDGFAPDSEKVAPRVNNAAHHVTLKKAVVRHH